MAWLDFEERREFHRQRREDRRIAWQNTTPKCILMCLIPFMLLIAMNIIGSVLVAYTHNFLWLILNAIGLILFFGGLIYLNRKYNDLHLPRPGQVYTGADRRQHQVPFPQQNEPNHPNRSLSPPDARNRRQEQLRSQSQHNTNLSPDPQTHRPHSRAGQGGAPDSQSGRHLTLQSGNEAPPPSYNQVMGIPSREPSGITIHRAYMPQEDSTLAEDSHI